MWNAWAKSRSVRGVSRQLIFKGNYLIICHMYLPCLPREWVSFSVLGAVEVSVWVSVKSGLGYMVLPKKVYVTLGDGQMVTGSGGSLAVKP